MTIHSGFESPSADAAEAWSLSDPLRELATGGDSDMVADILDCFRRDAAARIVSLRDAILRMDRDAIGRQAHSIKGSAIQVGARSLASFCLAIEVATRAPRPHLEARLAEVDACFRHVCDAIDTWVRRECGS